MVKLLSDGKPTKTVTDGSKCVIDETYSKLSVNALSSIAKADEKKVENFAADDKKVLRSATDVCAEKTSE